MGTQAHWQGSTHSRNGFSINLFFLFRILSVLLVLIIAPQRAMNTSSPYMATISFYLLHSDVSNLSHFFFLQYMTLFPFLPISFRHMSNAKICTISRDCFVTGVSQMFYCLIKSLLYMSLVPGPYRAINKSSLSSNYRQMNSLE